MFEQEQNKVLRDAGRRFPDGCLCEDCGVCAYCCFILSCLNKGYVNCAAVGDEPNDCAFSNNMQIKIPSGFLAQIYELRRVFRLCI
jgi:hypothetical protein